MALIVVSSVIWPGARLSFLLPAAFVCGAVVTGVYWSTNFRTAAGTHLIMFSYTAVVCGIILNINYFTVGSGGTYAFPVLHNNDALTDWSYAVSRLYGDALPDHDGIIGVRYYSYIMQGLMWIFGRDIGVPLMFNALCYSLTIILFGAIAGELSASPAISFITMGVGILMCYFMVQSTVLIKDVPLTMCVASVVLVMTKWRKGCKCTTWDIILLLITLTGISFLRPNFLLMLMLGAFIFCFSCGNSSKDGVNFDVRFFVLAGVSIVAFFMMHRYFTFSSANVMIEVQYGSGIFQHTPNVKAWDSILGSDYEDMSILRRILWLPASVMVQFLVPFPWNFDRDVIFGPTEALAHFGFFWYYAGAVLVYWLFCGRKTGSPEMLKLVLWGVLLTVLTAYMTSGRVSRYCLPYLPMLLPAVGYTLNTCFRKKSLWIWLGVFTALLIPTLVICHKLQMASL